MTSKLIAATALLLLLAVTAAEAQSNGRTTGKAAGEAVTPGNVNNGIPATGTGGKVIDKDTTGSTTGAKAPPPNGCDLNQAAKEESQPNQNNASASCVK